MTLFDDFIRENATEDDMWQIIEDNDLFDRQGWIGDCVIRSLADKFIEKHFEFRTERVTFVMDKLYRCCAKHFAFKYKEANEDRKLLRLHIEDQRSALTELAEEVKTSQFTIKMQSQIIDRQNAIITKLERQTK